MFRKVVIIIIIIAFLAVPVFAQPVLKLGSPPPSFTLSNLKGEIISLDQYLEKNVILLSFFTSWSKSCKEEILFLEELDNQYQKKNLKIIGISFDRKLEGLQSLVDSHNLKFDILHDKKLTTLKDFRILIIPTLFVIDGEGKIKSIYVDFDENVEKALSKEVQKLLSPPKKS